MTKDEALQMCLEYIEINAHERRCVRWAIKDALAEPVQSVQEPEWYHGVDQHGCNRFYHKTEVRPTEFSTPLYTTPPLPVQERNFCPRCGKRTADLTTIHTCTPPQSQWVNLTVDELIDLEHKHLRHEDLVQAIKAKLKENNT